MASDNPLASNVLRATILAADPGDRPGRGRIRELTTEGRVQVDARSPPGAGSLIRVQLRLGDRTVAIDGVVEQARETRVIGRLRMPPDAKDVVSRLLAAAQSGESLSEAVVRFAPAPPPLAAPPVPRTEAPRARPAGPARSPRPSAPTPSPRPVQPEVSQPDPSAPDADLDLAGLARRWERVGGDLDAEEAHAAFIRDCAKAGRLDVAVAGYRQLKAVHPHDPRVERRLQQVATLIALGAFTRPPDVPGTSRRVRILLLVFLAAAGVLTLIAAIVA